MSDSHAPVEEGSSSCPETHAQAEGPPLFVDGELKFQAHHVGWIVSGFFALIATGLSFWLIGKHLSWYTNRRQQRQIIRLLIMVPIYSIISWLAYAFWDYAIPLSLIRDAYEGIILAAFFYLLLEYLAPTPAEQKEYFRHFKLKKWAWPFGRVKRKPSGLYFLQLMKWSILQYCWIRPLTTLGAVVLNTMGLYCEISWSPAFGHLWILLIVSISVTVAMYCLIQLYLGISDRIKQHRPVLQLFSIKAIIFLMFWQSSFLAGLHSMNVIKDTKYMTAEEINIGFACLLQTFEMMCFAFLHIKCFSYKPYRLTDPKEQTKKWASLKHALDFRDFWRETRDGAVYMSRKMRGQEAEVEARRLTHFEKAIGRSRELPGKTHREEDRSLVRTGEGDEFASTNRGFIDSEFGVLSDRREARPSKSKAQKRYADKEGSEPLISESSRIPGPSRDPRNWWRRLYEKLATNDPDQSHDDLTQLPSRTPRTAPNLDDLPPPSMLNHGKAAQVSAWIEGLPTPKYHGLSSPPVVPLLSAPSEARSPKSPQRARPDPIPILPPHSTTQEDSQRSTDLHRGDSLLARVFTGPLTVTEEGDISQARKKPSIDGSHSTFHTPPGSTTQAVARTEPISPSLSPSLCSPLERISKGATTAPAVSAQMASIKTVPTRSQTLVTPVQPTPIRAGVPPVLELKDADLRQEMRPPQPRVSHRHPMQDLRRNSMLTSEPLPSTSRAPDRFNGLELSAQSVERPPRYPKVPQPLLPSHPQPQPSAPRPGPRRPANLVMPSPLSPARYPEARNALSPSRVPERENLLYDIGLISTPEPMPVPPPSRRPRNDYGYGDMPSSPPHPRPQGSRGPPRVPQVQPPGPIPGPVSFVPPMYPARPPTQGQRSAFRSPPRDSGLVFSPYEAAIPDLRTSRGRDKDLNRPLQQESRRRSNSPFGIEPATTSMESLPRHPVLRQQTARARRESNPLPDLPGATSNDRESRRRSEPLEPRGMPNNPNPPSPSSPNADSRYAGARSTTYFDSYDSPEFITNLMTPPSHPNSPSRIDMRRRANDDTAPYIPVIPSTSPLNTSPANRLKRR